MAAELFGECIKPLRACSRRDDRFIRLHRLSQFLPERTFLTVLLRPTIVQNAKISFCTNFLFVSTAHWSLVHPKDDIVRVDCLSDVVDIVIVVVILLLNILDVLFSLSFATTAILSIDWPVSDYRALLRPLTTNVSFSSFSSELIHLLLVEA